MEALHNFLRSHAQDDRLPWVVQEEAVNRFGLSYGAIEETALEINLLPVRYLRNRQTITTAQQLSLFRSNVAVLGCGGLGGYVIEELARLGVGQITVVDPDVFEEHNLNRQFLSTLAVIGKPKVEVAVERIKEINPAVTVTPVMKTFSKENGFELLEGVYVVVDGLDSIPTRLELADICKKLSIPLVHGGIAGWYGQVVTQFPGEDILRKIFPRSAGDKGIETELGNLSFTAGFVASIEAAEVCKILLNEGTSLRKRMLSINLLDMEIVEIQP